MTRLKASDNVKLKHELLPPYLYLPGTSAGTRCVPYLNGVIPKFSGKVAPLKARISEARCDSAASLPSPSIPHAEPRCSELTMSAEECVHFDLMPMELVQVECQQDTRRTRDGANCECSIL